MAQNDFKTENESRPALIRAMGRWDLTAVGVNQVIGSGIFIMPATVAATVGIPSSLLPWVAAGMANALIVLCFAEAGTQFREAGGPYAYARTAFGPFIGFEVAWMMWVTRVVAQAALANAFALYVGRFWAPATEGSGRLVVVTLLLGGLAAINLAGVRYGSLAINFFTISKLAPLALFLGVGIFFIEPGNFEGMFDLSGGTGTFGAAVLMLMFTFGGYELITIPASEARSPRRDAPRALLLTIGVVFVIYFLVQLVAVGTLPALDTSPTPLADAAEAFGGSAFGILIAIGGKQCRFNAGGTTPYLCTWRQGPTPEIFRARAWTLSHTGRVDPDLLRRRGSACLFGYVRPTGHPKCRCTDHVLYDDLCRNSRFATSL